MRTEIPILGGIIEKATNWYNEQYEQKAAEEHARFEKLIAPLEEERLRREHEQVEELISQTVKNVEESMF